MSTYTPPAHLADAGVPDVETLIADLEALEIENAPLAAKYANGALLWDAQRKAMWTAIADRIRETARAKGEKVTEAAIEQQAHADEQYQSFLRRSEAEKAEYHMNAAKALALTFKLEHARATIYRIGREAGIR